MGFRYRKSIRLMPGVRINLSKSGLSTSIGRKGATVNLSKKGTRTTIGIPGSGISYSHLESRTSKESPTYLPSRTQLKIDSVASAVTYCAVSFGLVLICQLPAMGSALIRYLIYGFAALSVIVLIGVFIEKRGWNSPAQPPAFPEPDALAEKGTPTLSEVRPVDRVWEWYLKEIQTFNAENQAEARAYYEAEDAHSLDRFCRRNASIS